MLDLQIDGEPLPSQYKDHPLRGNFAGSRDCHVESDWVLIYTLTENGGHVRFERTGTHSIFFPKNGKQMAIMVKPAPGFAINV